MSTSRQTVQDFMAAFIAAWPTGDAGEVVSFFSENAVYQNGPFAPVRDRSAIRATLEAMMAMGGEARSDVIHIVGEGPIVMTERVDYVVTPEKTMSLPLMGVFEVHDGFITAWRDYFDPAQFKPQAQAK